jgi:nitroreductase
MSVRSYSDRPIPDEVLQRVLEAARLAPSANNLQPWRLVLVQDADLKQKLIPLCWRQAWIAGAPVVIVACGLPTRGGIGGYADSRMVDVTIALDHLSLAAAAEGLGTCWIGAFDNEGLKTLLGIPPDVNVVAVMPLGYPQSPVTSPTKQRKPLDEMIAHDGW